VGIWKGSEPRRSPTLNKVLPPPKKEGLSTMHDYFTKPEQPADYPQCELFNSEWLEKS
jgi:hypothetical protein